MNAEVTRPRRRAKALSVSAMAAALLLAGCASVQIDVDVYKGPLINNEELQRDQVLSMALSARPMLLEFRNRLLDTAQMGWDRGEIAKRRSSLPQTEFDNWWSALSDADERAKTKEPKKTALRNARQLNAILTFYDDVGPAWLQEGADAIQRQLQTHDSLLAKFKQDHGDRPWDAEPALSALHRVQEAQAALWGELATLLREVIDRPDALRSTGRGDERVPATRQLLVELASRLAERTQPWMLACVLAADERREEPGSDLKVLAGLLAKADPPVPSIRGTMRWSAADYQNARRALSDALSRHPAAIGALRHVDTLLRRGHDCGRSWAGLRLVEVRLGLARHGLARGPDLPRRADGPDDDPAPQQSLDELILRLQAVDASGFEQGRIRQGIDTLSRQYALRRDAANRFAPDNASGAPQRELALAEWRRLEHLLIDLAGRMQFLATNMWLLKDEQYDAAQDQTLGLVLPGVGSLLPRQDVDHYKAMLEAISNNLLVYADDLRNRAQFDARGDRRGPLDRAAASAAFSVNGPSAFKLLEQQLELATRAPASTTEMAELSKKIDARRDELLLPKRTTEQLDQLIKTLGIGGSAPAAAPADEKRQRQADAQAVKQLAKERPPKSFEDWRRSLQAWLTQQLAAAPYDTPSFQGHPRGVQLRAALEALASIAPKDPAAPTPAVAASAADSARTIETFNQLVLYAHADAAARRVAEIDKDEALVRLINEQVARQRGFSASGALSAADAQLALARLREVRDAVLKDLAGLLSKPDYDSVRRTLARHLEKARQAADASSAPYKEWTLTLKAVEQLPLPTAVQLATLPQDSDSLAVLDTVIAQLRFERIEKLRLHGAGSPEAQRSEAALKQAMEDREQLIFIRPSSTYLRSVYTATQLQEDPTDRNNILLEPFRRFVSSSGQQDRTRLDLDKSFWQNINTVRVSAAGSSNFVLAKDDVGNWYVKAMGADPKSMINAAKGMALYSLGGRIDTDLLRADELQQKIDGAESDEQAQGYRTQLDRLSDKPSSRKAGSRTAFDVFVKNYDTRTAADRQGLASQLEGETLPAAIRTRWAATLAGGGKPDMLDPLLVSPDANKHLVDARDALKSSADAAEGIVKALQALQRLRVWLKAKVSAGPELVATEQGLLTTATETASRARNAVAEGESKVTESNTAILSLASRIKQAETAGTGTEALVQELDALRAKDALLRSDLSEARKAWATGGQGEAAALAALDKARMRQKQAADDVDAVLKTAIEQVVGKRLRVVAETETAVKVIGSAAN